MNILKRDLAEKILDTQNSPLTSNEMNVLLQLIKQQGITGYVYGVYWKDIANYLGISKSGYYHVIQELERKGFIEREKLDRTDTNIIIKDHDLTELMKNLENRDNQEKYIKLNTNMFNNKNFYKLKSNEKRLAIMLTMRYTKDNDGKLLYNPGQEYKLYAEKLGVDQQCDGKQRNDLRCIKKYFEHISEWIVISDDRVVNNSIKHIVTILKGAIDTPVRKITEKGNLKEVKQYAEYDSHEHILKTFCRRKKIDFDSQNLTDTAVLIKQYKKSFHNEAEDIFTYVKNAILISLNETIELSSKVVNKILSNISKHMKKEPLEEARTDSKSIYNNNNSSKKSSGNNRFDNLDQRNYDYDKLEKELLDFENLITEF